MPGVVKTEEQSLKMVTVKEEKIKLFFKEYYKDFNLLNASHNLFMSVEPTENARIYGKKLIPIMNCEIKGCPDCGHPVKATDYHKGDVVCEKCGLVVKTYIPEKREGKCEELPKNDGKLRKDERAVIKLEQDRKSRISKLPPRKPMIHKTDVKTWRKDQYENFLMLIASRLEMNNSQVENVKFVLSHFPLKLIHSRVGFRTIIVGLCRYILCRDGRGKQLQFSIDVLKENGLKKSNYEVIVKNIKRYKMFGH